jgi:integral membrane sensor domain MASE1
MLTKEEDNFITYWEANRLKQKKITNQWLIGLPAGLLFGLPILLNLFSGWNARINFFQHGQLAVLVIAVIIIIAFFSIFTVKHKWDLREQHYNELLYKKKKLENQ